MLTAERIEKIAESIIADKDNIASILQMSLEDVMKDFEKKGYDFTEDELRAFALYLVNQIENKESTNELNEMELENVSGGCGYCAALGVVAGAALGLGGTILLFGW